MRLLDDFIDGELPEIEGREVARHIQGCLECDREAESLRTLSHNAASLPRSIQPEKDLWPIIEAEILAASCPKDERKHHRPKAVVWGWRIAAIAVLVSLVLAGTYLVTREKTARYPNQGVSSNAADKQSSGFTQPPLVQSLDNRSGAPDEKKAGITSSTDIPSGDNRQPDGILTYPLDSLTLLSVSNYGIYGIRVNLDPSHEFVSNYIIRFDQNGTRSWTPPLPGGSLPISIYAGGGNRLWIAYDVNQPQFQTHIDEIDFGAESPARNIWRSGSLYLKQFVIGPQGFIYAAGYTSEFSKAVRKLTKGQSITAELVHIIDPITGEERHLFPTTIRPRFDTQSWASNTLLDANFLSPSIAVKSNGNFFLSIDRKLASASVQDLIKNEAVEYSPDGTVAKTWKLGTLESNAYLNRIFVDVDDSMLAEILRYSDTARAETTTILDRYFLKIDLGGRVTRYQPSFPLEEVIQGWVGQTRDLVTLVPAPLAPERQPVIRIRRLMP